MTLVTIASTRWQGSSAHSSYLLLGSPAQGPRGFATDAAVAVSAFGMISIGQGVALCV